MQKFDVFSWRTMDDAPRDVPVLLHIPIELSMRKRIVIGAYSPEDGCWVAVPTGFRVAPSHWQPLPHPPLGR